MSWKECDQVSEREEFVRLAQAGGTSFSRLCERFGVSRRVGYKWLRRFDEEGTAGLRNRSRRPRQFRCPTPPSMEAQILEVRHEHPCWGGRKIRARLQQLGHANVPAASTITAILFRHGQISDEEARKRRPLQRFERQAPNELWQMDFKGGFPLRRGGYCHSLTVLDDHSRFAVGLAACGNQKAVTVQAFLKRCFWRYGLPDEMLMDNGSPWGVTHGGGRYTRLTVWLLRLGIVVRHGRPYHPQTQGKDERFHRTLNAEFLGSRAFNDLKTVQAGFDRWRDVYNQERPHEALQMAVPASRYRASPREYPRRLPAIEYGPEDQVRRVRQTGQLSFRGHTHKISEAFAGERVALRPTQDDGVWSVHYGHQQIAIIDERKNQDSTREINLPAE